MDIRLYIDEFVKQNRRYKPYSKIVASVLTGGRSYSLNTREAYEESEYLPLSIQESVKAYSNNKDAAIALYKDFVAYLEKKGVPVPEIKFPPIPVSNTFERLMFIAKYLQEAEHRIEDLSDLLWVSKRTVEEDIKRLRDDVDSIQVCGKKFFIPDVDREGGGLRFASTAHTLFLSENLTQILVMLKGLKAMSESSLYRPYAVQTGREIWQQLSPYAKRRIRFVFRELMPEDLTWYEALSEGGEDELFHTETACSQISNGGGNVLMLCMKAGEPFCAEYEEEDGEIRLYKDCEMEKGGYSSDPPGIHVHHSEGTKFLLFKQVIRSARTVEELAAD